MGKELSEISSAFSLLLPTRQPTPQVQSFYTVSICDRIYKFCLNKPMDNNSLLYHKTFCLILYNSTALTVMLSARQITGLFINYCAYCNKILFL